MSLFDRIANLVRGMVRSAVEPEERHDERRVNEELAAAEAERAAAQRSPIAIDRAPKEPVDPHAEPKRVEKKM